MFCENGFALSQSVLLAYFLNGLEDPNTTKEQLYIYAALISVASFMRMTSMHLCAYFNWMCGLSMRSAAIGLLFRKVLSLRAQSMTKMQSGKIITIISADVERFTMAWFMHGMWLAPFMIAATVAIGWQQIGVSILAGIAITFIMLPLQMIIGKRFAKARSQTAVRTDKRVNAMNDILQGMRTVKMAAWEEPLSANVATLRKAETSRIWVAAQLKAFTLSFFFAGAHFPTFASIATFSASGGILTPANVFSVFTLFGAMRMVTAAWLPMGINAYNELKISMGRMQELLDLDDEENVHRLLSASTLSKTIPVDCALPGSVTVTGLHCSWNTVSAEDGRGGNGNGGNEAMAAEDGDGVNGGGSGNEDDGGKNGKSRSGVLNGVDFTIGVLSNSDAISNTTTATTGSTTGSTSMAGETLVVLGPVGSGKSTLLLVLLEELDPTAGAVNVNGLATLYAPQKPWIFPGSVRDNITFTYRYDAEWLARVVDACALTRDLSLFESGIDTEIGERGVTLSGGQKARLSLARAIYGTKFASAEAGSPCLVLLDDPFSALDSKVQNEVFEKVVLGLLKQHVVICITHNHKFAEHADKVLLLDLNGVGKTYVGLPPSLKVTAAAASSVGSDGIEGSMDDAAAAAATAAVAAAAATSATNIGTESAAPLDGKSRAAVAAAAGPETDLAAARKALIGHTAAKGVVAEETQDVGAVSRGTYAAYISAIGSPFLTALLAILMCAAQGAMIGTDFYLVRTPSL